MPFRGVHAWAGPSSILTDLRICDRLIIGGARTSQKRGVLRGTAITTSGQISFRRRAPC